MSFSPDTNIIKYNYIWTPAGYVKQPVQEDDNFISFVPKIPQQTGDAGAFTALQPAMQTQPTKAITVFPQPTIKADNRMTIPEALAKPTVNTDNAITVPELSTPSATVAETAPEFKKTGESFNEKMSRYYTKYKNATPEEQEKLEKKYISQHYSSLKDKPREEQIRIQLADYKKLLSNTTDPEVRERLVIRIQDLEQENQIVAAKSATVEEKDLELKRHGEIGVAKSLHNYHKDNQIEATKIVVESKNVDAIFAGSTHASELDKDNQVEAVDIYKTADISKEEKLELGERLVDQYKKFDIANQTDIHKIMSDKNYWDEKTIVYAATNIYQLDKTNQAQAVQITSDTKIEDAINAAAKNYKIYDDSARPEIKSIIENSDCDSANKILTNVISSAEEDSRYKDASTSLETAVFEPKTELTYTSESANESTTISAFLNSNESQNQNKIESALRNATQAEKITALRECNGNMSVIKALLELGFTDEVLDYMKNNKLSAKDQNELVGIIKKSGTLNDSKKLGTAPPELQVAYLEQLERSEFKDVKRDNLSVIAKGYYDERLAEFKKEDKQSGAKFGILMG